jgi:predicted transcriptional regulator
MDIAASKRKPVAFGISAKMARALANPWRCRILVEATVRALSPSEFVEEFGGDLPEIARCFRQLAEWGYLRVSEERPGRRRGTAVEHIYSAVRRAHFDTATWEGIPRSERDAASYSVLSSYFQRVQEALETGTFDAEIDRHLSWDAIVIDRRAWLQLGERLDDLLASLTGVEKGSMERLEKLAERPIPMIVGLASFRSPQSPADMLRAPRPQKGPADQIKPLATFGIDAKLAKALSNKWRSQILMESTIKPLSPSQFVEEAGGSMSNISRYFRQLAEWGYLELVEERKGGRHGGGIERIYKSTCCAYFDTPTWRMLPQMLREEISQNIFDSYLAHVVDAIEVGTFDAETDRHLSWKPLAVDRQAWKKIGAVLDEVLAWLPELEAESLVRTRRDTGLLIPTVVGLMAFRSPG